MDWFMTHLEKKQGSGLFKNKLAKSVPSEKMQRTFLGRPNSWYKSKQFQKKKTFYKKVNF